MVRSGTNRHDGTVPIPSCSASFRLYGDDFRPGNIPIDDTDDIIAVINW